MTRHDDAQRLARWILSLDGQAQTQAERVAPGVRELAERVTKEGEQAR